MSRPPSSTGAVYAIADSALLGLSALPRAVCEIAESGIQTIQLRLKDGSPDADLYRAVEDCQRQLEGSGVFLWMDDRADLAAILSLPGLHLGQADLRPAVARGVVGEGCQIGLSTHNEAQIAAAEADQEVDWVAIGPVFETQTKLNPEPLVGLEGVAKARQLTTKPLVAIGGIDAETIAEVLAAGADYAAVAGALCRDGAMAGAIGRNCRRLLAAATA